MRRSSVKRPRLDRLEVLPDNSMPRTALHAAAADAGRDTIEMTDET